MKRILMIYCCLLPVGVFAQWTGTNPGYFTSGNIGIGTTSPQSKLEVAGGKITVSYTNPEHTSGNSIPMIGSTFPGLGDYGAGINTLIDNAGSNSYGLQFITRAHYTVNPSAKMTISANGNVGIGTSTPSAKLHIQTVNNLEGIMLNHNNQSWLYFFSPSMTSGAFNGITNTGDAGIIYGGTSGANSVNYGFVIAPHRGSVSGLRIDQNGNVGIGTTNPSSYKLAVEGKIGAREVNVTTSSWSDYVFDDQYNLLPLDQLQTYIKENKHLPDVPSETEVLKNGQDLGAMNAVLLRKIEELTLYVIELKRDREEDKKRIGMLEHKN